MDRWWSRPARWPPREAGPPEPVGCTSSVGGRCADRLTWGRSFGGCRCCHRSCMPPSACSSTSPSSAAGAAWPETSSSSDSPRGAGPAPHQAHRLASRRPPGPRCPEPFPHPRQMAHVPRPTRDASLLAPRFGPPPVGGVRPAPRARAAPAPARLPRPDPATGAEEPLLRLSADSWRTAQAWASGIHHRDPVAAAAARRPAGATAGRGVLARVSARSRRRRTHL
jgi:hypothetical protein